MGMLGNLRTLRVCVELMESSTKHFHIRGAEEQTRKCCTERQGIMPGVGFRTRCLRLSPGFRTSGYSSPVGFPVKPTPVAWQSRRTKRLVRCLKAIAVEADGRGLSDTASRRTPKKKTLQTTATARRTTMRWDNRIEGPRTGMASVWRLGPFPYQDSEHQKSRNSGTPSASHPRNM